MGAKLSRRVGTDPYYASYEKAFERLEKESSKILDRRVKRRRVMEQYSNIFFWMIAVTLCLALIVTAYLQHRGKQNFMDKTLAILSAFSVPVLAGLMSWALQALLRWREAKDEKFLKRLMDSKRKMVKDLKDSTRFDRTMTLIKKYDPDEQNITGSPIAGAATANGLRRRPSTQPPQTPGGTPRPATTPGAQMLLKPAAAAANAAASMASGTGKALMPMFGHLANNLIGDNPVLVEGARQAQEEAYTLRAENVALKQQLDEIKARLEALASLSPDLAAGLQPAAEHAPGKAEVPVH